MREHTMNDPTPVGRALSSLFSVILPGSGQLYQGYVRDAFLYLGITLACWLAVLALVYLIPALPTWFLVFGPTGHVLAAIDAGRKRPPITPPEEQKRRLP